MEGRKAELLQRIESDREVLLAFFRCFIRCSSPNPPGDTREAADHIRQFLVRHGTDCRVIAPNEIMPNIVATFEAGKPGRHLALNGHIDCFPVGDGAGWTLGLRPGNSQPRGSNTPRRRPSAHQTRSSSSSCGDSMAVRNCLGNFLAEAGTDDPRQWARRIVVDRAPSTRVIGGIPTRRAASPCRTAPASTR